MDPGVITLAARAESHEAMILQLNQTVSNMREGGICHEAMKGGVSIDFITSL